MCRNNWSVNELINKKVEYGITKLNATKVKINIWHEAINEEKIMSSLSNKDIFSFSHAGQKLPNATQTATSLHKKWVYN